MEPAFSLGLEFLTFACGLLIIGVMALTLGKRPKDRRTFGKPAGGASKP